MRKNKGIKRVIWQNYDVQPDDEFYKEEYPDLSEDGMYNRAVEDNDMFLDDERDNLNIQLDNPILVIADLGLWNGRHSGYKIIQSGNIKDILYSDCDYVEWYSDGYNILARMSHHDGTNYLTYKEIRSGVDIDNLLNKIYNGKYYSMSYLRRYTRSILPYVAGVYGWPCRIKTSRK
jgi:hypothetical protein